MKLHLQRRHLQLGLLALGGVLLLFPPWQFVLDVPQQLHLVFKGGHCFVFSPPALPRDEAYERWEAFVSEAPMRIPERVDRWLTEGYKSAKDEGTAKTPEEFAALMREWGQEASPSKPRDLGTWLDGSSSPEPETVPRAAARPPIPALARKPLTKRDEAYLDSWTEETSRAEGYRDSPAAPQWAALPPWPHYAKGVRAYWDLWYPEVDWGRLLLQAVALGILATAALLATRTRSGVSHLALQQPSAVYPSEQPPGVPENAGEAHAATHVHHVVAASLVPPEVPSPLPGPARDPTWEAHVRAIAMWLAAWGFAMPFLACFSRAVLSGAPVQPFLSQRGDVYAVALGTAYVIGALGLGALFSTGRWVAVVCFVLAALGNIASTGGRSSTVVGLTIVAYSLACAAFLALPRTARLFARDYRALRKQGEPVGSRALLKSAWFWAGIAIIAVLIGAAEFALQP